MSEEQKLKPEDMAAMFAEGLKPISAMLLEYFELLKKAVAVPSQNSAETLLLTMVTCYVHSMVDALTNANTVFWIHQKVAKKAQAQALAQTAGNN
jgi:hypothetical protein